MKFIILFAPLLLVTVFQPAIALPVTSDGIVKYIIWFPKPLSLIHFFVFPLACRIETHGSRSSPCGVASADVRYYYSTSLSSYQLTKGLVQVTSGATSDLKAW